MIAIYIARSRNVDFPSLLWFGLCRFGAGWCEGLSSPDDGRVSSSIAAGFSFFLTMIALAVLRCHHYVLTSILILTSPACLLPCMLLLCFKFSTDYSGQDRSFSLLALHVFVLFQDICDCAPALNRGINLLSRSF